MDGAQDSDLLKTVPNYDKMKELQAFDATKAGVKGLLDSGIVKIPKIFIRPPEELSEELNHRPSNIELPVIDFDGLHRADQRSKIVDQLKIASEKWGFFQVINHGIPMSVLDNMINGVQRFHEQDQEVKKQYYTRDHIARKIRYNSNYDLYKSRTANWRDTLMFSLPGSYQLDPSELPIACREASMEYIKNVTKLGNILLELSSEALGLKPDHLRNMECANGCNISCHYYPACPEPEVTLGATKHTDPGFLTILLQNHINGLQVLYNDQWVNVHPIPGGLVVNIGDLFQLISNAKFKSNVHRVLANRVGPRISVASFFAGPLTTAKLYGPIKELITEENPPLYREVVLNEYAANFYSRALDAKANLHYYKL